MKYEYWKVTISVTDDRRLISESSELFMLFVSLFLLLTVSACSHVERAGELPGINQGNSYLKSSGREGGISLFLNYENIKSEDRKIVFHSADILSRAGKWHPLVSDSLEIESSNRLSRQAFVSRSSVPGGYYEKIRMTVTDNGYGENNDINMVFEISPPLFVGKAESKTLFLQWLVSGDTNAWNTDLKMLALLPKRQRLPKDIAYAACPHIDTVYMICIDKNQVCDSLGISGYPDSLSVARQQRAEYIYALASRGGSIVKISVVSNRIETSYRLPGVGTELEFTVDPEARYAFVIDRRRSSLIRIDLLSGVVDRRRRMGYGPVYIDYIDNLDLLAVSQSLSNYIAFIDPETLNDKGGTATSSKPEGVVSFRGEKLYIAETTGNSIVVYDFQDNRTERRIPVGVKPRRLTVVDNSIYVANSGSRTLSVINKDLLGISQTVRLDGVPFAMAYSENNKLLYVSNLSSGGIDVIYSASGKQAGQILLGTRPNEMVVLR